MGNKKFQIYVISGASRELGGEPASNLRYYSDTKQIPSLRADDGSRLFTPEHIEIARQFLKTHAQKKAAARADRKKRQAALRKQVLRRRAARDAKNGTSA